MHRFYLDSNVYRLIKPTHPFFDRGLLDTMHKLKDIVFYTFSDAHLEDLKGSTGDLCDSDLELIGRFVGDNYFSISVKNEFQCLLADPKTAFSGKSYSDVDHFFSNPERILDLLGGSEDNEELKVLRKAFDDIMNLPISDVAAPLGNIKYDSEQEQIFSRWIPNFHPDMTIKDFWTKCLGFSTNLMFDKKEMSALRRYISKYFDRNDYSWDIWKQGFDQRLKASKIDKSFSEIINNMLGPNQMEDLYLRFSYAYSMLELMNITQERNGKKSKSFTLDSLTRDAHHAYFAAFNDYLVTDDKGLQLKAHILFQLFGIKTKVLTINDFKNIKHFITIQEETYFSFKNALIYDIDHSLKLFRKEDFSTGHTIDTFKTTHTYFNYFNRLQIVKRNNSFKHVLYCERGYPGNFLMFRELELIVKKITKAFGIDDEAKGLYSIEEKTNEDGLRSWTIENVKYELLTSSIQRGSYICLYFEL